ncbi:head GIN domain-containing protein [Algoriphagus sp. PAP.12]|uniref:head GIN domain-containing protein n=1 Tax=Algoriphagus sp. PAP.12 TaxID=2996678 RepID=UPI00227C86C2|nr:head GIN domain-containing protein [Algoriphagus sp. PAP.12]
MKHTMNTAKTTALIVLLFLVGLTANAQGTETRTPGNFTKIESGGSWDVFVEIGNRDEVRIESENIDLDKIITEVDNGRLKLKLEKGNYRNVRLKFYVTMREIEGLGSSGSGSITVEDNIETDKLALGVSGSGLIKLKNVHARTVSAGISGSGDILIEGGSAKDVHVGQSGSGNFEAIDLEAESVDVGKSGSGKTYITAMENLKVGASGSGNVYYRGDPRMQVAASGSAKVVKQ